MQVTYPRSHSWRVAGPAGIKTQLARFQSCALPRPAVLAKVLSLVKEYCICFTSLHFWDPSAVWEEVIWSSLGICQPHLCGPQWLACALTDGELCAHSWL